MNVLKKGSKGDDVKKLQTALGLVADGSFGDKTDAAVKAFQKSKGLVADGIVGEKTWNVLFGSTTSKCIDSKVIYKPLSVHITPCKNRPIKYLAIHFTAGSNSNPGRAQSAYNTFVSRSASADFAVDDRDMVQFNPDIQNNYCWAVGDAKNRYSKGGSLYGIATNKNTVSIEICSTCIPATSTAVSHAHHSGWLFTDAALQNAATLAKIIMKKYNIPLDHVVRHYDISGKLCPGIIGWINEPICDMNGKSTKEAGNSAAWEAFKSKLNK